MWNSLFAFMGTMSISGVMKDINRAALTASGLKKGEVVGKHFKDVYWWSYSEELRGRLAIAVSQAASGETVRFETEALTIYGNFIVIDLMLGPVYDQGGNMTEIVGFAVDITENKSVQRALRESEERLRLALEASRQGIYDLDIASGKIATSDEYALMLGYDPATFREDVMSWRSRVHPDDLPEAVRYLTAYLAGEIADYRIEYRMLTREGKSRWILSVGKIVSRDSSGAPLRMLGTHTDVTDRVNAERALRESEQTLSRAQKVARIWSWKIDFNNDTTQYSKELGTLFSLADGETLNYEKLRSFCHPDDESQFEESWKVAMKTGLSDLLYRIVIDNKVRWIRFQIELTSDSSGMLTYGFGTIQDITDQQALQDANHIFNQSQMQSGLGSWRWNIQSDELFWSENVYNLFGLDSSSTSANYEQFFDVVHPEDRQRVQEVVRHSVATRTPFEVEYRILVNEYQMRWIAAAGNVLTNRDGEAVALFGILRNITSEKATMDELIRSREIAEEASIVKDEFLSVMSHEIRTPLNSVIGLSNLLLRRNPREDQMEIVRTLNSSADNLLHLVNDILDFNKIRIGKVELEMLPFSLRKFLRQLHSTHKLTALDKGLEFTIQTDPEIPPTLLGDVTRLNQIFNNLLSNSIKFTHIGSVRFSARLLASTGSSCTISFIVDDTGAGIAADKLESIFQPFNQSERDIARKYGGTGLGLSIVKSLVEVMGGTVKISSEKGKGSVFEVTITFASDVNEHHSDLVPSVLLPTGAVLKGCTVLYVEDVEPNRLLVGHILSDAGIECVCVNSGRAAIKAARVRKFDVILMDLQMPGMDGYRTTKELRERHNSKNRKTPVLAFTAEPNSELLRNKVVAYGLQDLITKPFDTETLLRKIAAHVRPHVRRKKFFSFEFYEMAFDGDPAKLKPIKKAILADLKLFLRRFLKHHKKSDVSGVLQEIHRIRPIIKNLKCETLISRFDKYNNVREMTPAVRRYANPVTVAVTRLLKAVTRIEL